MSTFRRVFSSSVGTKLLIGLTGLALFAYLVLHLAGNVLIFAGPETFNEYSHALISNPLLVPDRNRPARHFPAPRLQGRHQLRREPGGPAGPLRKKKRAGPHQPQERRLDHDDLVGAGDARLHRRSHLSSSSSARGTRPAASADPRPVRGPSSRCSAIPVWVALYVVATLLVGLHLRHGISSSFQSLGARPSRLHQAADRAGALHWRFSSAAASPSFRSGCI